MNKRGVCGFWGEELRDSFISFPKNGGCHVWEKETTEENL